MQEITDTNDLGKTRDWFINNLKVNKISQQIIVDAINTKLKNQNISIKIEDLPKLFT